ncbi:hypothetical protein [Companilactobacillus baiquanensis]|uniref:IpaB/EvcA family protein n=1 Tax=Companilactobacillus baiquanensis TaxID=2486005 RepID=A0ABW1UVA1_9LACO|nr:hypothetical protein [Companilactobacillus baiquanensis]
MEKIERKSVSSNILEQIDRIEQTSGKKVVLNSDYKDHDTLTLDQASHEIKGEEIIVVVTNEVYRDFVLAHELYHVEIEIADGPKIYNSVTSGHNDIDGRIISTANSLQETLEHALIVKKQTEDGTYTYDIKMKYLEGIDDALDPGVEIDPANMRFFRTLLIFDAMIFGEHTKDPSLKNEYPTSFKYAKKLSDIVDANDLTSSFQFRRALIRLLEDYNDVIISNGFEGMYYHEFLNITPVVSERQLRLSLNQVYQIKHSNFTDRRYNEKAFVLLGINDGQSVASLDIDPNKVDPQFYQKYYQQTVKETFESNDVHYLIR